MHQQFQGKKVDKATYLKVHKNPLKKVNFCKIVSILKFHEITLRSKEKCFFDYLSYQHNHLPLFLLFHFYSVELFHHFLFTFFIHTSFLFESTLLSCNVSQRHIKLSKYLGKVQIQTHSGRATGVSGVAIATLDFKNCHIKMQ